MKTSGLSQLDELALKRLGTKGLGSLKHLWELARACDREAERTGDARFAVLAQGLKIVAEKLEEHGALPVSVSQEIDSLLARHLEDVLSASTSQEGTRIAARLRDEIQETLTEWGGNF